MTHILDYSGSYELKNKRQVLRKYGKQEFFLGDPHSQAVPTVLPEFLRYNWSPLPLKFLRWDWLFSVWELDEQSVPTNILANIKNGRCKVIAERCGVPLPEVIKQEKDKPLIIREQLLPLGAVVMPKKIWVERGNSLPFT